MLPVNTSFPTRFGLNLIQVVIFFNMSSVFSDILGD